jgi:hypothetical protein
VKIRQSVVGHGGVLLRLIGSEHVRGLPVTVIAGSFPAQAVDRAVARGRDDPSGRARGQPGGWPSLYRFDEGVLDRLLGHADIAKGANQHGNGATVLLTEDTLDPCNGQVGHAQSAPS